MRRAATLQWLGLFVAPFTWIAQHAIGQGISQVSCSRANTGWSVSNDEWQIVLIVVSGLLILFSEGASIAAFLATRDGDHESPPPLGRVQLVSVATMCTNFLFLVIVLLDGVASIVDIACRQS